MHVFVVVTTEGDVEGVFTDEGRAEAAATLAVLAGANEARSVTVELDERPLDAQ